MIVVAVIIISLFRAETSGFTDMLTVAEEGGTTKYTALTVMWGLIGALFLSFEIMCNKWLMNRR